MLLTKLSFLPWRKAPMSHMLSSVAVGFLLLLAGFLYWMQSGLKPVLARLQGEQVITAYLDATVGAKDEDRVVDSIRTALGAHAQGTEIRFVGSQQFVDNLKGTYPDLSHELEDLGSEMSSVVPRYVSVSGMLPNEALARVKTVPGIESAETSKDRYAHIVGAFMALRWVAKLLAAGVCFALLTGLIHLARMNAYLHREALQILKLWGASSAALRTPGMISGALVGALGGAIACAGWMTAGTWFGQQIRSLSPMLQEMPKSSLGMAAALLFAGILIGLMAGVLGGVASSDGAGSSAAADARS